jgi:hypothetical protein
MRGWWGREICCGAGDGGSLARDFLLWESQSCELRRGKLIDKLHPAEISRDG